MVDTIPGNPPPPILSTRPSANPRRSGARTAEWSSAGTWEIRVRQIAPWAALDRARSAGLLRHLRSDRLQLDRAGRLAMPTKNWPLLVGACLLFGVLMAIRSEVDGVLLRTLVAALAGGVLGVAIHSARRDRDRSQRRHPGLLSSIAGEFRRMRRWPARAPRMLTGIEGGPPYCEDA